MLDWVAGLLAGAGCAFTICRPGELRTSVRALADRLGRAAAGDRELEDALDARE